MVERAVPSTGRWQSNLANGDQVGVLGRPNAINLIVNDEQPSLTFDPAGRLHGAFWQGRNYRRSLDNRVLCKWRERSIPGSRRRHRWLPEEEARTLVDQAYGLAREALLAATHAPSHVRDALSTVARWDWAALEQDRECFQQIYTPIGILPPDQYLSLVLQATHGCSHNACTFCTFYRDQTFRIKSPQEFRQHVAAVLDFLGPALALRRSIFLADANALVVPMGRLLGLLDVLTQFQSLGGTENQRDRESEGQSLGNTATSKTPTPQPSTPLPIHAFIDAFHVHRKSLADWQELKSRGLQRVTIGMESGHDPLLRWLNKPGTAADVLEAVTTLKQAGLQASVIIMLGIGGQKYAAGHVADTASLLNTMPLARGDLIYLSHFVDDPEAPYGPLAQADGVRTLDQEAMDAQGQAIQSAFVPQENHGPPQFAPYNIHEFVY